MTTPRLNASHSYDYGEIQTAQPFKISSCWRGTLDGQAFTLIGYGSASAESAVVVEYKGERKLFSLGIGSPIVTGFIGSDVCFIPSPAKGIVYAIDMANLQTVSDSVERFCNVNLISREFGKSTVLGLKKKYKVGYGVKRLYP